MYYVYFMYIYIIYICMSQGMWAQLLGIGDYYYELSV